MAIEGRGDEVRENGRGRRALRQAIAIGRDLSAHGGRSRAHLERRLQEQPAHAAEVDGREEILEVDVEHPALAGVIGGVGGDAAAVDEAVRVRMRPVERLQVQVQLILELAQKTYRRVDGAHAAGALGDLEVAVAGVVGRTIERPDQIGVGNAEISGHVLRRRERSAA